MQSCRVDNTIYVNDTSWTISFVTNDKEVSLMDFDNIKQLPREFCVRLIERYIVRHAFGLTIEASVFETRVVLQGHKTSVTRRPKKRPIVRSQCHQILRLLDRPIFFLAFFLWSSIQIVAEFTSEGQCVGPLFRFLIFQIFQF